MDRLVEEKYESLMKYIPFIDFILQIDKEKYIKFVNIKNWIVSGKRKYPLSDLNKFEKAITTQYKNLLLDNNVTIPEHITTIFAPMKLKQFVNLCSDDEEENDNKIENAKTRNKTNVNKSEIPFQLMKGFNESDDDLEIISVDFKNRSSQIKPEKKAKSKKSLDKRDTTPDIDKTSMDILNKIDQLAKDDLNQKTKIHEPIIYTYLERNFEDVELVLEKQENEISVDNLKSEENNIFQRRSTTNDELFKRRKDFQNDINDEVEVNSLVSPNKNPQQRKDFAQKSIEIISLDSDSDKEQETAEEEEISDDNSPSTSKTAALKVAKKAAIQKINNEKEQSATKENVNTLDDYDENKDLGDILESVLKDFDDLSDDIPKRNTTDNNEANENDGNKDQTPANKNGNISELVNVISKSINLDMNTVSAALEYIKQQDNTSPKTSSRASNPAETPPPAPPPINNTIMTPTPPALPQQYHGPTPAMYSFNQPNAAFYNPPQLCNQVHRPPLLTPNYAINNHFPTIPNGLPAPRPKANDPRIIKQLQQIKNSPLMTYNVLNPETAASILKICESQQLQSQAQKQPPKSLTKPLNTTKTTSTSASKMNEEYLRRKNEQKMEEERLREERKTKVEQEKRKLSENDIRSQLLSTLKPYEDKLTALCGQKTKNNFINQQKEQNNNNKKVENVRNKNETNTKETTETNKEHKENQNKITSVSHTENNESSVIQKEKPIINTKKRKKKQNKNNSTGVDQKLNKVYNELKCTFKGFEQLQDYICKSNEENLNGTREDSNDEKTNKAEETTNYTPRPIGLRRRSSMHALTAISEQLGQQLSDTSDHELSQNSIAATKRRLTNANSVTSQETISDDIIKPKKRAKHLRITDDDNDEEKNDDHIDYGNYSLIQSDDVLNGKQVIIKLKRLSPSTIKKHCKKSKENKDNESIRLRKKCEKPVPIITETINNKPKRKCNNDCQMTERNTVFCVLCSSKPSDLTNHYVGKHKTESYVSRLEWSELDELIINTNIAKLHPKSRNMRADRFEVYCPFCKETQLETFMNLYYHFSYHTGEYAFQCGNCSIQKPYKPDIQSHILHSRPCRNSNVKTMYRYATNAQCIYLHYCNICNFVQINEANVFKHLREHHDRTQNIPSNVSKCILVAMSDVPDVNENNKPVTPTPTLSVEPDESSIAAVDKNITNNGNMNSVLPFEVPFKVDDDDVPVGNEPCIEDDFIDDYSIENQLKQMHREPTLSNPNTISTPMTVIHCMRDNFESPANSKEASSAIYSVHKPMCIKDEAMDVDQEITPQPTTAVQKNQLTQYEKYRHYPQNVNYLGLYKCMIDDCYYSIDSAEEFYKHIVGHKAAEENSSLQFLQCPYCIFSSEISIDVKQLIEHIQTQHSHMIYQCSLCCYRSCEASNVQIHQQLNHELEINNCKIYKCCEVAQDSNHSKRLKQSDLQALLEKHVSPIYCKICNNKFYQLEGLKNHETSVHKIIPSDLKIYSCIYCPLRMANMNDICNHLATKHPNQQTLIYDYNASNNNKNKSCIDVVNIKNISKTVESLDVNSAINEARNEQDVSSDIKPSLKELMQMNEETIRVRLRKLTAHTGIPPDNLYRCPEPICGGFFSAFELWLKHMKNRHHCIECKCPHCKHEITIQQFQLHFEQHRRHTFVCYHCSSTFNNETLAREHFKRDHSNLGDMRLEKIRFNISYSYTIMIQSVLHQEREHFITEFLMVLDKHLKALSTREIANLKHHWPVQENSPWLDDYIHLVQNRKVVRNCLLKDCGFRTNNTDYLYSHLKTMHSIENSSTFNCSTCGYRLYNCNSFDVIIDHLKTHNDNHYICTVCTSFVAYNRLKISAHIAEKHSARDVPIMQFYKNNQQLMMAFHIAFAEDHFTFSTMKNCFCCAEKNMDGAVFILHLKHYHKFTLNYYCDKCMNNLAFGTLNEVKCHFQKEHPMQKIKLRCKLAANHDLGLTSLNDFQIKILDENQKQQQQQIPYSVEVKIKDEPEDMTEKGGDDDNVIVLEDDDIIIQNSLQEAKLQASKDTPKLKCISLTQLQGNKTNNSPQTSEHFQQHSPTTSTHLIRLQNSGNVNVNTLLGAGTPMTSTNNLTTITNAQQPVQIFQTDTTTIPRSSYVTNSYSTLRNPIPIAASTYQVQQSTSARLLQPITVPQATSVRFPINGYATTNSNVSDNLNKTPNTTTTTYYIRFNNTNPPPTGNNNLAINRISIPAQNCNSIHQSSALNVPYNVLNSHSQNACTSTPATNVVSPR
ncbi:uncharacterized protein ACRADG_006473 [Cochliomyia hominivorax]